MRNADDNQIISSFHSNLWEKACETDTPECKGTVGNLIEGMDYQFRIVAVNRAGLGEPSEPSKTITAKARFGECLRLIS